MSSVKCGKTNMSDVKYHMLEGEWSIVGCWKDHMSDVMCQVLKDKDIRCPES